MPTGDDRKRWAVQEAAAAGFFWLAVAGVASGALAPIWLLEWWVVGAGILVVNQVRTLAAHGYDNEGEPVSDLGQLLDSINLRARVLTVLAAPVGMRYHALHHFLPGVPYHSLGALHRRLLAELPSSTPYRRTERGGILTVVADLLRGVRPGAPPLAKIALSYDPE